MNARDNTPLRAKIAARLAAGEDTAAGIAQAIGKGDTPSIVVKELNAMRTDGQVECEQRELGKKKGLVYWLAVPIEVAAGNAAPESPDERDRAYLKARAEAVGGATLRDYFAAAAMQGMVAQPESGGWPAEGIAKAAYQQADAMLSARKGMS